MEHELGFFTILKYLPKQTYIVLFIIIVARIVLKIFEPKIKGFIGENRVRKKLDKLPSNEFSILHDVLINNNGTTTQIDHVVASKYGIFVIETKHYKGWIHGGEFSNQWTQSIYKKKIKIPNPVKQNYGHIQHLKELLNDYNNIPFFSIIVFTGSAELKNISIKTSNTYVIYANKLVSTIKQNCLQNQMIYNNFNDISLLIKNNCIKDKDSKKQHINNIKASHEKIPTNKNEKICANCGSRLIKRKGKYGEFLGCSNFPKCKYTSKI